MIGYQQELLNITWDKDVSLNFITTRFSKLFNNFWQFALHEIKLRLH